MNINCVCPPVTRKTGVHLNGCPAQPARKAPSARTLARRRARLVGNAINLKF